MKIAYIVPGTGDTFYCGNCFRDSSFLSTLKETEHEIIIVPMYLPLSTAEVNKPDDTPIFYGAVNLYLKQTFPVLKKMPDFISKLLDSRPVLKFAAKRSGSTKAVGLEKMTISMLNGEKGNQSDDLKILINWFKNDVKPDVVHISNALLLGLAPSIKKELKIPVVCSLQDEDEWLDEMSETYQKEAWGLINFNAGYVDAFISVSHYFSGLIQSKVPAVVNKIEVVYNGVDIANYKKSESKEQVIGYMSKMNSAFGLDILIEAFILLKQDLNCTNVKLKITGGYSGEVKQFVNKLYRKLKDANLLEDVEFIKEFSSEMKYDFFNSITVLSVPAIRKEAFGMYLIEAFASGVPVVQPNYGAYPEIINITKAGLLYQPNTAENLCKALKEILSDKNLYESLRNNALSEVETHFSSKIQIEKLISVYKKIILK